MRAMRRALILVITVTAFACSSARRDAPTVGLRAVPERAAIGEPIELIIEVPSPRASLDLSPLADHVTEQRSLEQRRSLTGTKWHLTVTAFQPGAVEIPSLPVQIAGWDPVLFTPPVTLVFTAPEVSPDTPLRPMTGRLEAGPAHMALTTTVGTTTLLLTGLWARRRVATTVRRWQRRRRWRQRAGALRDYGTLMRDAGDRRGRPIAHAAAALIRSALAEAIDPAILKATTGRVGHLVLEQTNDSSVAAAVRGILAPLDDARFSRTVKTRQASQAISDASALLDALQPDGVEARRD